MSETNLQSSLKYRKNIAEKTLKIIKLYKTSNQYEKFEKFGADASQFIELYILLEIRNKIEDNPETLNLLFQLMENIFEIYDFRSNFFNDLENMSKNMEYELNRYNTRINQHIEKFVDIYKKLLLITNLAQLMNGEGIKTHDEDEKEETIEGLLPIIELVTPMEIQQECPAEKNVVK